MRPSGTSGPLEVTRYLRRPSYPTSDAVRAADATQPSRHAAAHSRSFHRLLTTHLHRARSDREEEWMKVLVAGDRGYIGAVLVPFLQRAGHEVDGLDSDSTRAATSAAARAPVGLP